MKTRDLIKLLNDHGFWQERQRGGHTLFKNEAGRAVPVPASDSYGEMPPDRAEKILRAANLAHILVSS